MQLATASDLSTDLTLALAVYSCDFPFCLSLNPYSHILRLRCLHMPTGPIEMVVAKFLNTPMIVAVPMRRSVNQGDREREKNTAEPLSR